MDLETGFPPYPDFLRIFNLQEHSLRLVFPGGYKKYYPEPLPQTALLKNSEGIFWTVKWRISQLEETISFQEGWEKFVKENGLIDRDFLLFTYDGSRSFWVRILRNGQPVKASTPIKIQELSSDDEDETTGDNHHHHHIGDKDSHENMIISLSLGSSDEVGDDDDDDDEVGDDDDDDDDDDEDDDDYDYDYDDDTTSFEVNKPSGSSRKAVRITKDRAASIDLNTHLDNPKNPFFIPTSSSRPVLVIAKKVIRDYDLKFDLAINLIDGFGELKRKVRVWKDRVVVLKWDEMYKRNDVNPGDMFLCEILREDGVVRFIKVHFLKK